MTYMVHWIANGPIQQYHRRLVKKIVNNFEDINKTYEQKFLTHCTLLYPFPDEHISSIEEKTKEFCRTSSPKDVLVGGFADSYKPHIVIHVHPTMEAQNMFKDYIAKIKEIKDIEFDKRTDDIENKLHITLAENCGEQFNDVLSYLKDKKERFFTCSFDNICILKRIGTTKSGYSKWKIDNVFDIKKIK